MPGGLGVAAGNSLKYLFTNGSQSCEESEFAEV